MDEGTGRMRRKRLGMNKEIDREGEEKEAG